MRGQRSVGLSIVGRIAVQVGDLLDGDGCEVGGGVVIVIARRFRRVLEEGFVPLTSCCPRILFKFLEVWRGSDGRERIWRGSSQETGGCQVGICRKSFIRFGLQLTSSRFCDEQPCNRRALYSRYTSVFIIVYTMAPHSSK